MHFSVTQQLNDICVVTSQPSVFDSEFPLYVGIEIQGFFKDFQRPWSCIFKDKFSMEVYSMDSITAIFNICFCDYGTVLVDNNY